MDLSVPRVGSNTSIENDFVGGIEVEIPRNFLICFDKAKRAPGEAADWAVISREGRYWAADCRMKLASEMTMFTFD